MKYRVRMFPEAIKSLTASQKEGIRTVAAALLEELKDEERMPYGQGDLQERHSSIDEDAIDKGLVSIQHDSPYASRLYFHPDYTFDKGHNSNAGASWWEEWINGSKKKRPEQLFKKFFKKLARRYVK